MSESVHTGSLDHIPLLDIVAEAISGAILIYDSNDILLYASAQIRSFLPLLAIAPAPGTRLRDLFGAIYDQGGYSFSKTSRKEGPRVTREDWIAGEIASLWKERVESVERRGSDRWMSLSKRRLPSGYGICVFRDVSEHRKREDQWRADLERVQVTEEILDNLPFPVMVKDRNLSVIGINKASADLFDHPQEEILGRRLGDLLPVEVAERIDAVDRRVLETGEPYQVAEHVVRPDGGSSAMVTHLFRVGKPGRYLVVTAMEDVTELLQSGVPQEAIFHGLEGVDFIHSDLRPMARQETASAQPLPHEVAGKRVLLVTQDAKGEAECLSQMERLGLDATAARSADEVHAILEYAAANTIGIDLIAIDNAMDLSCLDVAEASGVDVMVFDSFQLGCELVQKLARHLSQPRPDAAAQDASPQHKPSASQSIDVLVAEDNAVNRIVFQQILEGFGYRYAIAGDGEEVVRMWRELNPRIVLMDITLPKLNGFEAASKIRESEEHPGKTPIIGVLSPAVEGDRDACWAAGMNDVVLKPLSPDSLEEKFRKFLCEQPPQLLTVPAVN
ncbi:response regulator [Rhizobium helianthi]|uniref:Response regulator n=1 Tax=Rhizobium helianthi TaxID=1132695 RepID=A0ABW4M5P3_9HYPH